MVAGSCAEYRPSDHPLRESDPIEPWSVYGATKAALRLLLASSLRPPSMRVTWARLFNITGPGEHPDRLVPSVVRAVAAGHPVDLSPGEQTRDFLDVDDVAGALVHLSSIDVEGPVNVCSGIGITLRSLLEQLADRVGDRSLLRFGARGYGAHDPMMTVGDAARLTATSWSPSHTTTDMIDRVADLLERRGQPEGAHGPMKLSIDTEARTLVVGDGPDARSLDLYSTEAFHELSRVWVTTGWALKYPYGFSWMGRPIIQLPEDMITVQEVIYRVKPDVIVETGIAHGGSLIYSASLCRAIGKGPGHRRRHRDPTPQPRRPSRPTRCSTRSS